MKCLILNILIHIHFKTFGQFCLDDMFLDVLTERNVNEVYTKLRYDCICYNFMQKLFSILWAFKN